MGNEIAEALKEVAAVLEDIKLEVLALRRELERIRRK